MNQTANTIASIDLARLDSLDKRARDEKGEGYALMALKPETVRAMIALARRSLTSGAPAEPLSFQARVEPWMAACFGPRISADTSERNHRFFEEATELAQAGGMPKEDALMLVEYVYGRPMGELHQEVGGVMVTLAALCLANKLDMHQAGETELARIWTKVDAIRAKQASKPKGSPLPIAVQDAAAPSDWINDVVRDVAELPDRDSPADQPDMMLVTVNELRDIIARHAPSAGAAAKTDQADAWRVGEFWSSANPGNKVLILSAGAERIQSDGQHKDFIRLVGSSASAAGAGSEQEHNDLIRQLRNMASGSTGASAQLMRVAADALDARSAPSVTVQDERALFESVLQAKHGGNLTKEDMDACWSELPGYAWRKARAAHPVQDGEKDAQRYRWLRRDAMNPHLRWSPRIGEPHIGGVMYRYVRNEQEFDAALDAAMVAAQLDAKGEQP